MSWFKKASQTEPVIETEKQIVEQFYTLVKAGEPRKAAMFLRTSSFPFALRAMAEILADLAAERFKK